MKILSEAVISKCGKRGDRIKELEAENKKLNMETYEQMELMKKGIERIKELEKENEELKTMVNRNAGDVIYHQAEKIKLQDINATLKTRISELKKQLHKEYAPQECLLISGRVFANILEEKQKEWEKLQELKSQLESAVKIIKSYQAGFNTCVKDEAEQFLKSLKGGE